MATTGSWRWIPAGQVAPGSLHGKSSSERISATSVKDEDQEKLMDALAIHTGVSLWDRKNLPIVKVYFCLIFRHNSM
jgi:hypothetical protein